MGKRIKMVWIEVQGFNISAPPAGRFALPISPIRRWKKLSANFAFSARVVFLLTLMILTWGISLKIEAAVPIFFGRYHRQA